MYYRTPVRQAVCVGNPEVVGALSLVERPEEDRPPLVVGLEWSARIMTVGFEIALPTLAGWWLDRRLGTNGWVIAGALLGVAVGSFHLVQMALVLTQQKNSRDGSTGTPPTDDP